MSGQWDLSMYEVEDTGHEWQWDLNMYVVEDMGHKWP